MTRVREHRGGLAESMATVRDVKDRDELVQLIRDSLQPFGFDLQPERIRIEPYGYDNRIDWNTFLISIEGYGVWGMSDGPVNVAPTPGVKP